MNNDLQHEIQTVAESLKNLQLNYWKLYVLSWRWNMLLALLIISWILLIFLFSSNKVIKKQEYFLFTVLVAFLSSILDQFGVGFGLFSYAIKVVPAFPTFFPGTLGIFPAALLMVFHFTNKHALRFYSGVVLFAAVTSFIVQPWFVYMDIYIIKHWHFAFSFLTIVLIAALARYLTNTFTSESSGQKKNTNGQRIKINARWFRQKVR